ncbi:hypothetical protein KORDIASMS9_04053 [Kordia sp. SMS9]|uniref:hypothetical protein n=1 Tax=Kordia sp. SMS9 TaxID=2282170 RepID=UPI000E0D6334|nr:hypothetical protein [Kordia sp. SMS9]AXG71795.1 hypothetical protein KORDIASMS9_04053 [Kordia sp. SMS9]
MSETHTKASYYFQSYQDYFWEWEIDHMFHGNVIRDAQEYHGGFNCISIPDGMTIVYKEQVTEILQLLSDTGLPPFGAIILTFLATNSGEVAVAVKEIFNEILEQHKNFPTVDHIDFAAAEAFLSTLIGLPATYKKGKNRLDLFVFLFETANHSLSPKFSEKIIAFIQHPFKLNECSEKEAIAVAALSKDINALALLHHRYPTVDTLLTAWFKMTEIPVEPEDAEVEHYSEHPDFIQELIEDPKSFFMGSLIKRLWSGIQLPMHYVHPGEMPLGGISDVTNKGKFDNILISEFANDDLIFLHRIANKEALFIRRETTPEEDLRTRIFLIDTTIKNWGTPKILSFATAFSFIHHPKNEMNFQPYALGETCTPLHFDTKEKIINGLQRTSPLLDASQAIENFILECEEENIEITLFTTAKTLEHQHIRRLFNLYHTKFGGVITSDSQGNIDVYKMKNGAKRLLKHIQLPLQELWAHPPRKKRATQKKSPKEDPYIVNYPLLYGFPTRVAINFTDENHAYILQKNGDLFCTDDRKKGFTMIQRDIRFITGIKQEKMAVMYQDELLVLFWTVNNHMVFKSKHRTYSYKFDMSKYKKAYLKHLIVHKEDLYLVTKNYYSDPPVFTYFEMQDRGYMPVENPSEALQNTYKAYLTNKISYFDGSVFTKINAITLTLDLELVFNFKHRLDLITSVGYFELIDKEAAGLDEEFTIHLHNRNQKAVFEDGSVIEIDKNGIISFKSSNPVIPTFYLASYIGIGVALSTGEEFAGNDYFLPKDAVVNKIQIHEFDIKYIEPFIQQILYGE